MQDGGGEQHQQHVGGVLNSDPRFLVATTVAALLLAGSALIWRSGNNPNFSSAVTESHHRSHPLGKQKDPDSVASPGSVSIPRRQKMNGIATGSGGGEDLGTAGHTRVPVAQHETMSEWSMSKDAAAGKSSRPKERRKRGKDVTKEILKSSKLKTLGADKLASPLSRTFNTNKNSGEPSPSQPYDSATYQNSSDDFPSQTKSRFSPQHTPRRYSGSVRPNFVPTTPGRELQRTPSETSSGPYDHALSSNVSVVSDSADEFSPSIDGLNTTILSIDAKPPPNAFHERAMAAYPPPPQSPTNTAQSVESSSTASSSVDPYSTSLSSTTTTNTSPALSLSQSKEGDLSTEPTLCILDSELQTASSSFVPKPSPATSSTSITPSGRSISPPPSSSSSTPAATPSSSSIKKVKQASSVKSSSPWDRDEVDDTTGNGHKKPSEAGRKKAKSKAKETLTRLEPESTNKIQGGCSSSELYPYASVVSVSSPPQSSGGNKLTAGMSDADPEDPDGNHIDIDDPEDDVISPLTFPSLNDPSPSSSSLTSSLSRLQQVKSKSKSPASSRSNNSSLGPYSRTSTPPSSIHGMSLSPSSSTFPSYITSPSSSLGNPHNHVPRRAPTPRDWRPPTPSHSHGYSSGASTPPLPFSSPSSSLSNASNSNATSGVGSGSGASSLVVSVQTQLASMRGALEAARLREEKSKSEMEKINKEMETLKWENSGWRRREGELQSQVHHMMHQMQTYATLFTAMGHTPYVPQQAQQSQLSLVQSPTTANAIVDTNIPGSINSATTNGIEANIVAPTATNYNEAESAIDSTADVNASHDTNNTSASNSTDVTIIASTTASATALPANVNTNRQPQPPLPHLQMQLLSSMHTLPQQHHQQASNANEGVVSPTVHSPMGTFPPYPPLMPSHSLPVSLSSQSHGQAGQMLSASAPMPMPFPITPVMHGQVQPGVGNQPRPQFPPVPFFPFAHSQPQSPIHTLGAMGPQPSPHLANSFSMFFPPPHSPSSANPNFNLAMLGSSSANLGMTSTVNRSNGNLPSMVGAATIVGRADDPSTSYVMGSESSIGPLSPDLDGSPTPAPVNLMMDRGRGRLRGPGRHGGVWEGTVDTEGWVASANSSTSEGESEDRDRGEDAREGINRDEEDEDQGFNELLADAILKRPASIRVRSKQGSQRSKGDREKNLGANGGGSISLNEIWNGIGGSGTVNASVVDQQLQQSEVVVEEDVQREFTFPSLSELGNVRLEKRMSAAALLPLSPPLVLATTPPPVSSALQESDVSRATDIGIDARAESFAPLVTDESVVSDAEPTPEAVPT